MPIATDGARPLILAVDDERALADVYREVCRDEGWQCVVWTAPGDPAIVAAVRPALILTDLAFAGDHAAGRAFIEALATDPATVAVPVAVCSADLKQLESGEAWLGRACARIAKPFELETLVNELRRCLGGELAERGSRPLFH